VHAGLDTWWCLWNTLRMEILVAGQGRRYVDGDCLDHGGPLVFTVPGVLLAEECADLVAKVEEAGFDPAPVTTAAGPVMLPGIRNNTRVMFDDVGLAAELFGRIRGALPERLFGGRAVGVNERFRCYRYEPGQRFAPHHDGAFRRSSTECSELTFMVYLNQAFGGGGTAFHDFEITVRPSTGMALLFQHQLLHEGCAVTAGRKYVLRSDVMYAA
jgi:prolyl 4-hydroxylase